MLHDKRIWKSKISIGWPKSQADQFITIYAGIYDFEIMKQSSKSTILGSRYIVLKLVSLYLYMIFKSDIYIWPQGTNT